MINKIVPRYRAHNYCSTKHKGHIFQFKAPPPPWWQRFSIDPAHSTLHKSSIERRTGRRPPYINDRSPLGVSVFRSCAIIPITCMVALRAPIISKMPADKKECTRVRKCGEREKKGIEREREACSTQLAILVEHGIVCKFQISEEKHQILLFLSLARSLCLARCSILLIPSLR